MKTLMIQKLKEIKCFDEEALEEYLKLIFRSSEPEGYFERHHILPQSLFPEYASEDWNVINLSAHQHYMAHYHLAKAYKGSMLYAYRMMSNCDRDGFRDIDPNLKAFHYEELKIAFAELLSNQMTGDGNPMYGSSRIGDLNPMYGKNHTEETKKKISELAKERFSKEENKLYGERNGMYGKPKSKEFKESMSKRLTGEGNHNFGKPQKASNKEALRKANTGRIKTEEELLKISQKLKGTKKNPEQGKKLAETRKNLRRVNLSTGKFKWVHKDELVNYFERDGRYYDFI